MPAIATSLLPSSGRASSVEPRHSTSASRLNQIEAETRTSTDFAFVTAEGDKITLSTDALSQAVYTSYDARGRLRGQRLDVHAETLYLASAQKSALSIEGELSQEEIKDIQRVLDTLGKYASDLVAGTLEQPLEQLLDLHDLDTLQSVDASLEYSQSVTVSQLALARVTGEQPLPPVAADTPGLPGRALPPSRLQHLRDEGVRAVDTAHTGPGAARAARLLEKIAQKLAKQSENDTPRQQAFTQLASQLLYRLSEQTHLRSPLPEGEG